MKLSATVPSIVLAALGACIAAFGIGCSSEPQATAPQKDVTDIDPAQGRPEYWLKQSPTVSVADHDFDKLWSSAEGVSQSLLFTVDRRDRRDGLMTTEPMLSAQWFEPWRRELQTWDDLSNSSTAAYRRTIYWQFAKQGSGYTVTPRVLVERESVAERPVSAVLNRGYFRRDSNVKDPYYGTTETDQGIILPQTYWYPVSRDFALENKLVEMMRSQLQG